MSSPVTPSVGSAPASPKLLARLGWLFVLVGLAYFILSNVPRYLVLTADSYGSYFWPRRAWLLPHVVCGVVAAVLGPIQFWPSLRQKYLQAHRITGRVYVAAVLAAGVAGLGLTSTIPTSAYSMGLSGLAVAWLTTTIMALVAIRRKNLLQHKQWMVRSYVVTFAFVSFRLVEKGFNAWNIFNENDRGTILAWGCWALPLLVTEVILQSAAIFKPKA